MARTMTIGASGKGKSYYLQSVITQSVQNFDSVVIFDYEGEYKGLCKGDAPFKSLYLNNKIISGMDKKNLGKIIAKNPYIRLETEKASAEEIRELFDMVCDVVMDEDNQYYIGADTSVFLAVDEAQYVSRQGELSENVSRLSTGARKYGVEWCFSSQRPTLIDQDILTMADYIVCFGVRENDANRMSRLLDIEAEKLKTLPDREALVKNLNNGELGEIHTDDIPQPYEHVAGDDGRADEIFDKHTS